MGLSAAHSSSAPQVDLPTTYGLLEISISATTCPDSAAVEGSSSDEALEEASSPSSVLGFLFFPFRLAVVTELPRRRVCCEPLWLLRCRLGLEPFAAFAALATVVAEAAFKFTPFVFSTNRACRRGCCKTAGAEAPFLPLFLLEEVAAVVLEDVAGAGVAGSGAAVGLTPAEANSAWVLATISCSSKSSSSPERGPSESYLHKQQTNYKEIQ